VLIGWTPNGFSISVTRVSIEKLCKLGGKPYFTARTISNITSHM